MEIRGNRVYSKLKYESGVHRVQRVPQTEAQGRVHTSTATVAIMPEVDYPSVIIYMTFSSLRIWLYFFIHSCLIRLTGKRRCLFGFLFH